MKTKTFEAFEELQVIFESATARGNNAFGLGGDATAEAFEVENDVQEREDVNHMEYLECLNQDLRFLNQHLLFPIKNKLDWYWHVQRCITFCGKNADQM